MARKKRDKSHVPLCRHAESLGATVRDVTQGESVGFDAILGYCGHNATVEIKRGPKDKLTGIELKHAQTWRGAHACVHSVDQMERVVSALGAGARFPVEWRYPGW